jgi:simple sugar transport system ATP-binding protein
VRPAGARVLTIENLRMAPMVKNNSLSVFAGQVTGVFGLVGRAAPRPSRSSPAS